jgi:hypothetical protein
VADEKEFRERVQQIGRLITALNEGTDDKTRTAARDLVQLVMELHGAGLEKMMEIIFAQGSGGAEAIDRLARDRVVSSLLVLHGLHPDDFETRVKHAVEEVSARLRKQEVEVRLVAIEQNSVRVHANTSAHACASTAATVRAAIEEAAYEAAPEITQLTIEGLEAKSASGFVGLEQLMGAAAPVESNAGD